MGYGCLPIARSIARHREKSTGLSYGQPDPKARRRSSRRWAAPLTTYHLPMFEMGTMAVELLEDMMGGLASAHDQLKVECTLIERASG